MSLGTRIITAFRWGAGVKLAGQVFTWAITIIVIRLLSPADYGLMAMAVIFTQFLMLVNELGLGAVLVYRSDLDTYTKRQIFGLVIAVNSLFFVLLFLAAPLIAAFFDEPLLVDIIRVLAFQFVIAAFEIIPVANLERELDFKRKSLVFFGASMVGGVSTLLLAIAGYGVWALVWGNMLVVFLQTLGVNVVAPFRHLPVFSLKNMRDVVSFGGLVTLERAMWFLYTQADVLIVGKLLGKDLLGIYAVAMHLASLIMHKTGGVIYEVAFPSFSRANEEPNKVASYFLKAVRIMSFLTFPVFLGMSSVAPEMVAVLLGETWHMAGGVLAILAIVMPLRMLSNLLPPALQGVGRPDVSVKNLFVAVVVMPLAFLVATNWGLMGVSVAWLVAYPVVFMIIVVRSADYLGITVRQFLTAMAVPAFVSIVMYIAVITVKPLIAAPVEMLELTRLIVAILVGASLYSAISFVAYRDGIREVLQLVRR